MRLEIDVGNTRMKWRLVGGSESIAGVVPTSALLCQNALSQAFSCLQPYIDFSSCRSLRIKSIYISSVVPDCSAPLKVWCLGVVGIEPLFAVVSAECAGVTNGYNDISQMGVDRWLAMLSAYRRLKCQLGYSGCLVVGVGSAMTIDILLANGSHKGGYIVPGLHMMNDALFKGTGRVKVDNISYPDVPASGASTRQAVSSGLPLMLVGLIQLAYAELASCCSSGQHSCGGGLAIYIAGGDGDYIAGLLERHGIPNIYIVPDLVIDGLHIGIEGR